MGFLVSVLGGGGSLFIIPVLLFGFGQDITSATGTSLVIVLAGALVGAIGHFRAGRLNLRAVLSFGPASMLGAVFGAYVHGLVPEKVVFVVLILVLVTASLRMMFGALPEEQGDQQASLLRTLPLGFALGMLTGFIGLGGGFLIVPALVWGAHLPLKEAIGTSVALIAVSSATAAVTHIAQQHVDFDLAYSIGGGAMIGALLGAPLAGKLPERPLRIGFGVMVLAAAIYIVIRTTA